MDPDDHRLLGPRLDLFHQQEEAPGGVFWHPRGAVLYGLLESWVRGEMRACGYQEVRTPQLLARALWERSGHAEKFAAQMFVFEDGGRSLALKPMSCPAHVQIFRQKTRSHHDLPLRLCEFGRCHRHEPSGALHGLLRMRAFTQDDAHIFCLPGHVDAEVAAVSALVTRMYRAAGFGEFSVGLSTRPAERAGTDAQWDQMERMLAVAARRAGLSCREQPGEGAFYGPKLEFLIRDRLGRDWQCGTLQLDPVQPQRLEAEVVMADGSRQPPLMIHHAVLGSLERFIALLLEQHRGTLPFWLAPEQVTVAPVGAAHEDYARTVMSTLQGAGLRCAWSGPHDTLSRRIVDSRERGIPVFATAGAREAAGKTVALRGGGGRTTILPLEEAAAWLKGIPDVT
jgi:threonyl-tRNA synthetase